MLQRRARITSRGQITIPRDVRRLLGVRPGDALLFEGGPAGVRVRPLRDQNPGIGSGRKAIVSYIREIRGR